MNLSKTTGYALQILSFMATREEALYSAEYLYGELKVPRRYLRRLLTGLSHAGLITGTKGRNGGFVFARDPGSISLKEIIDLMEGPEIKDQCILGLSCCVAGSFCALHEEWVETREKMAEILAKTTLGMLKEKSLTGIRYHQN